MWEEVILTRKMHMFGCALPKEIMEHGDYYQYLKLEQSGEHLHAHLNTLERQFACIKNVAERYYHMIKKLTNNGKIDDTLFEV